MADISKEDRIKDLVELLSADLLACDLKITIFISTLTSFKQDSLLKPFPQLFIEEGVKNWDKLDLTAKKIPVLSTLLTQCAISSRDMDEDMITLVHWILTLKEFKLKSIPKNEFPVIFAKSKNTSSNFAKPQYIFEVTVPETSGAEKRFQDIATDYKTSYAYHGTKFYNLFSILNYGLQQHLNKVSVFGEGIYLADELQISLLFSESVLGWKKSQCGELLSSICVCEYIDDKDFVKIRKKENPKNSDIPEKYLLITNNDVVRVRYLMIYSYASKVAIKTAPNQHGKIFNFCKRNLMAVSLVFYISLLLFIGMSTSRTGEYYKQLFYDKVFSAFEEVQNFIFRK